MVNWEAMPAWEAFPLKWDILPDLNLYTMLPECPVVQREVRYSPNDFSRLLSHPAVRVHRDIFGSAWLSSQMQVLIREHAPVVMFNGRPVAFVPRERLEPFVLSDLTARDAFGAQQAYSRSVFISTPDGHVHFARPSKSVLLNEDVSMQERAAEMLALGYAIPFRVIDPKTTFEDCPEPHIIVVDSEKSTTGS